MTTRSVKTNALASLLRQFLQWLYRGLHFVVLKHLALGLVLSALAGFTVPTLANIPPIGVQGLLGIVMLFAWFELKPEVLRQVKLAPVLLFYAVRFLALPILMYSLAKPIAPGFASGVLLFFLMPAGVSSPALCASLGGSPTIALALVLVSSLLTPFAVPAICALMLGTQSVLPPVPLLLSLMSIIFIPALVFLPLKRSPLAQQFNQAHGRLISVLIILLIVAIVIAKQKPAMLSDLPRLAKLTAVSFGVFAIAYGVGWWGATLGKKEPPSRAWNISYACASGLNNVALGVSLAFLYGSALDSIFLVICEVPWGLALIPFKALLNRLPPERH
ncbi:MAG: hypothetical protein VKJ06_08775 [Vampirovibrionales bacterium]|nr:hypothetical protein [Vampirovibrionales bacterium]